MFKHRDGMDNAVFGDAHFATLPEVKATGLLGTKGIRLGYYRAPDHRKGWGDVIRYAGDAGLITIAPARRGKSRDVLVAALLEYEHSVIVVDPKGELACLTAARRRQIGRVFFLNPFGVFSDRLGPSACYNPTDTLDPSSPDWDPDCRKIAEGLIVGGDERDSHSHWTSGARGVLTGVIGGLVAYGAEDTKHLGYVREVICSDRLLMKYARAAQKSDHAFVRQELASYTKAQPDNPAELAGFKQTAREQTSFLGMKSMVENLLRSDLRFRQMKDEPITVYLILPDNRLDVCGRWFRLIVASALDDLWRGGKGKHPVLTILDEFAQIGHLKVLENAAAAAAGRGVQIWPILQNLAQLQKDYPQVWETFLSAADIRMFFAPREPTTAEYISKLAGQRTVTTAGQSVNTNGLFGRNGESDSSNQAAQPLIRPHEVSELGRNEMLIFGPDGKVIDALRQPYFDTPELAGLYGSDPMNHATPDPPVNPNAIVTFADRLAASEESARRARKARRPFAMRVLTPGGSRNPLANAFLKLEYVVTLPIRLVLALIALPFALHNRPLGAIVGFLAMFGFWEIWNGLAKQPITYLYDLKATEFQRAAILADPNSTGDLINSRYKALKWLVALPFRPSSGPSKDNDHGPKPSNQTTPSALGRLDKTVESLSGAMEREYNNSLEGTPLISREEQRTIVEREMADLLRNVPSIDPGTVGIAGSVPPAEPPFVRFARPAVICHEDALFAPLPSQGPTAELYIAGRDGSDLKKTLRIFAAQRMALGTAVRPLLNSKDEIVRPADDLILVSIKGQIGVVFEHDLLLAGSPSR